MTTGNPFEHNSRAVKVVGILAAIDRFSAYRGSPVTARELLSFRDESWLLLAMIAGITPPSPTTRSLVIERVAERDAAVCAANEAAKRRVAES